MSVMEITKACTLKCDYCFDKVNMDEYKKKKNVLMEDETFYKGLARTLEAFKNKPISERSICITGGEPTLHPNFKAYVNRCLLSGVHVHLLTNFTFNDYIQGFLKKKKEKVSFMVNINDPEGKTFNGMNTGLWEKTMNNLKALESERVRLSVNVWNPSLSYDFIFDVLEKHPNLDKTVRVGIVNPIVNQLKETVFEGASWIKYKMLGKKIDMIVEKLYSKGYKVFMDCGAGHCVFSEKTLSLVNETGEWNRCSLPIPEINIDRGYTTCFAMVDTFNEDRKINIDSHGVTKYVNHMSMKTEFFKNHYLTLPKCQTCPKFNVCPKFCTSNNVYYWNRELKLENLEKIKTEEYFSIYNTNKSKSYSIAEFLLSYDKFDVLHELLKPLSDRIKEDGRIPIYLLLTEFFLGKINKSEAINKLIEFGNEEIITELSDKKLLDFAIITLRKS